MPLLRLDHVNLKTARLDELTAFYTGLLGLRRGPRPPFADAGEWLYCGEHPAVHLVAVATSRDTPPGGEEPRLSHFAFAATGLAQLLERLRQAAVPHRMGVVPGSGVKQVNLRDPDGNALHIDFPAEEEG